mmetsp:Transcript_8146/g.13421  ORF Transcript_8146/g.13421 Transcript_8146/m.13421 type:complete len:427 (-) Transcript_8146:158-1438(-)
MTTKNNDELDIIAKHINDDELQLCNNNLSEEDFHSGIKCPSVHLRSIDLSRNSFKCLPPQIFTYTALTFLDVSRNRLQGLPNEIKLLVNLEKLIAVSNHFRLRQLPVDELASLHNLKLLDLRYNRKLKQSALKSLNEVILPNNSQLEIRCTISSKEDDSAAKKLSACDRDATLLQSQLEPLSTPQLVKRLERSFGVLLNKETEQAYNRDYIMTTLLECYEKHGPREIRREKGIPVPKHRLDALVHELNAVNWPQTTRERPKIKAEHYLILQKPGSGVEDSVRTKKETAKLNKYKKLFDLAVDTLAEIDPVFAERFTALAVTHNFIGSPHIDTLNVGPFYGLSLGEFSDGGRIAVECSPLLVAEIDTKGKFGKVDGRFPHWVTPYEGERFSLIYYVTSGSVEPQTTAIFAPPPDVAPPWIPPPTFVP